MTDFPTFPCHDFTAGLPPSPYAHLPPVAPPWPADWRPEPFEGETAQQRAVRFDRRWRERESEGEP